jgi:IgA Peptidase M64
MTYGGGGIFNQYATVAIDNLWAGYVGVHEFGHQFAALADEYYTSDVQKEGLVDTIFRSPFFTNGSKRKPMELMF